MHSWDEFQVQHWIQLQIYLCSGKPNSKLGGNWWYNRQSDKEKKETIEAAPQDSNPANLTSPRKKKQNRSNSKDETKRCRDRKV